MRGKWLAHGSPSRPNVAAGRPQRRLALLLVSALVLSSFAERRPPGPSDPLDSPPAFALAGGLVGMPEAMPSDAARDSQMNSLGMTLVYLPPDEFAMGSPNGEEGHQQDEGRRRVQLARGFYLGAHEVTVAQFRVFVEATDYRTDAERDRWGSVAYFASQGRPEPRNRCDWRDPGFAQSDSHPAVLLSWNDAEAFCRWLSERERRPYRLPTEAEWEYACRAGSTGRFSSGEADNDLDGWGNVLAGPLGSPTSTAGGPDPFPYSAPVGSFRANAFGLHDMHGNASEWCADWYEARLPKGLVVDPTGPDSGTQRVFRGGGFLLRPGQARSANRAPAPPAFRDCMTGFRVALDVP